MKVFMDSVIQSLPATETRLKEIAEKQRTDCVCAKLIHYYKTEWPETQA